MTDQPKPPTRFTYHASWIVTDPADGSGLEPISPGRMSRVIGAVLRRLVDDDQWSEADVGAVSVICQQEPGPELLYQYRAPGPEQAKTIGTFTAQTFAVGELPMIPPPSGHVGPSRGGGRAP